MMDSMCMYYIIFIYISYIYIEVYIHTYTQEMWIFLALKAL